MLFDKLPQPLAVLVPHYGLVPEEDVDAVSMVRQSAVIHQWVVGRAMPAAAGPRDERIIHPVREPSGADVGGASCPAAGANVELHIVGVGSQATGVRGEGPQIVRGIHPNGAPDSGQLVPAHDTPSTLTDGGEEPHATDEASETKGRKDDDYAFHFAPGSLTLQT